MDQKLDLSIFREKFILEAKDRIAKMNSALVYFEKNTGDTRLETDILREAHTLKGAAKMMGQAKISDLAHKFEDVLTRRKEKRTPFNKDLSDVLFQTLDALGKMADSLRDKGPDSIDLSEVVERLRIARAALDFDEKPSAAAPGDQSKSPAPAQPPLDLSPGSSRESDAGRGIRVEQEHLDRIANLLTNAVARQIRLAEVRHRVDLLSREQRRTLVDLRTYIQNAIAQGIVSPEFVSGATSLLADSNAIVRDAGTQLANMKRREEEETTALTQNIEDIRSEVFSIRLVPLSPLFDSFQRSVRDLSRELDKEIELVVRGGKTEIDRKVAEALADPLVHLIRNAVDHGIETASDRIKGGKSPKGRIVITATPKKGRVVVEVEDDGKGIDLAEVRDSAIRKGLVTEKAAFRLDDREVMSLIFRPGFSTAKKVGEISGRGIGMDVVRATAEKFNGTVDVVSTPGKGTKVLLELPFTTAVSRVLLVVSGGQYFGLPIMHSDGLLRFHARDVKLLEGRNVLELEGQPVPVVWMSRLFDLPEPPPSGGKFLALLVRHSQRRMAIVVERVEGEAEIVVRDLGSYLGKVPLFMGSTLLGTGEVALLLDVYDVMNAIRVKADTGMPSGAAAVRNEVLVIDDSLLAREMQMRVLVAAGYKVETAAGIKAALDVLPKKKFALVVAGSGMHDAEGFDVVSRIHGVLATRDLPVLLVVPDVSVDAREKALAAGAADIVSREAFDAEHLVPILRKIVHSEGFHGA